MTKKNEAPLSVMQLIYLTAAKVYTDEYADDVATLFMKNTDEQLMFLLKSPAEDLPSEYVLTMIPWSKTDQGHKFWERVYNDFLSFELKTITHNVKSN